MTKTLLIIYFIMQTAFKIIYFINFNINNFFNFYYYLIFSSLSYIFQYIFQMTEVFQLQNFN